MRTFLDKSVEIKRLSYVGDKSSLSTLATVSGYLRQMSEEQSSLNNIQYGQGFKLIVEDSVDIKATDNVVIDGVSYTVKGVASHDRGSEPYKSISLIKGQN